MHDAKNEYSAAEDLSRNQQKEQSRQYKGGAEMGRVEGGRPGVSTGMQELKWIQPPLSFTCVSLTLVDWLTQKAGNKSVRLCGGETCKPHVKARMKGKAEVNLNEEIYYFQRVLDWE